MKEAENGDVLDVDEFIQPVDMQDRNLSHFISEMNILKLMLNLKHLQQI